MDKIISYKKLEGLNKKDLDIQQKIYKKEVAYYKGFKKKYVCPKGFAYSVLWGNTFL